MLPPDRPGVSRWGTLPSQGTITVLTACRPGDGDAVPEPIRRRTSHVQHLAALYSWIFLLIAVLGAGSFALDALLRQRRSRGTPTDSAVHGARNSLKW